MPYLCFNSMYVYIYIWAFLVCSLTPTPFHKRYVNAAPWANGPLGAHGAHGPHGPHGAPWAPWGPMGPMGPHRPHGPRLHNGPGINPL